MIFHKLVTIGPLGLIGDEIYLQENYEFTVVALRQPTLLYSIERQKLETATNILGHGVIKEMVAGATERYRYRLQRLMKSTVQIIEEGTENRKPRKKIKTVHMFAPKYVDKNNLDKQFK